MEADYVYFYHTQIIYKCFVVCYISIFKVWLPINISFKFNGKRIPDRCVTSHDIDKNIHFGLSSWQKNAVVNRKEIDLAMPQENLKRRK